MNPDLPAPIARYLAADAHEDEAALRDCFTDDAQVHDEGDIISGIDNIVAWKRAARQKYRYRVEPLEVAQDGMQATLHARVSGNFPGSPVQLAYHFQLRAQRIAALRIG